MRKAERESYILCRAEEMAKSGQYTNWRILEAVLRADGFREARQLLDCEWIRRQLNEYCAQSRSNIEQSAILQNETYRTE